MQYCEFLAALFNEGRVTVPDLAPIAELEMRDGDALLIRYERDYRLELPGIAPCFDILWGRWAAVRLYRACQFTVHRDVSCEIMKAEFVDPPYDDQSVEGHYSSDLAFRYLPDLIKFAASMSEADPLVELLRNLAIEWPLSSVGMDDIEDVCIEGFIGNACLRQLYVDRILENNDCSRLSDQRVRDAVTATLGSYPELHKTISEELTRNGQG